MLPEKMISSELNTTEESRSQHVTVLHHSHATCHRQYVRGKAVVQPLTPEDYAIHSGQTRLAPGADITEKLIEGRFCSSFPAGCRLP